MQPLGANSVRYGYEVHEVLAIAAALEPSCKITYSEHFIVPPGVRQMQLSQFGT